MTGLTKENWLYDQETVDELLKQRDELLDVVEKIAKVDTPKGEMSASCRLIRVKYLAQDAIEKVKGGAE